jgi:D-glycero-alpha-D-manno-heptose-7-phosphate kinase
MFYTGEQRSASTVLTDQRKALLTETGKFKSMQAMVEMAHAAKILLEAGDIAAFGSLLHDAWAIKRTLTTGISSSGIDEMYDRAREAGAWGGKLLGAGGGGFLLLAAPVAAHAGIREALGNRQELALRLDHGGSKVIYVQDES